MEDLALVLCEFIATPISGGPQWRINKGIRLHGQWMRDGNFYFPMSVSDTRVVICLAAPDLVGPIVEKETL